MSRIRLPNFDLISVRHLSFLFLDFQSTMNWIMERWGPVMYLYLGRLTLHLFSCNK